MKEAQDFDPQTATIADLLAFYGRRGYQYDLGRGDKPALVIIDFSVAFTRGTENFPGGGYDDEVAQTAILLDASRKAGIPVIYTTISYGDHTTEAALWAVKIPWIAGLKNGTIEVEIDDRLSPVEGETVLVKKYPSAFFQTGLDELLRQNGVDTIILAGCTVSSCVRATAVDAMGLGYRTILADEALGEMNPILRAVHMADLRSRYADVSSVADTVAYVENIGQAAQK